MMIKKIAPEARISPTAIFRGTGQVFVERFAVIEDFVLIDTGIEGKVFIGERAKLKQGVIVRSYDGFVDIGARVTIGEYTVLAGHGGLTIGETTIIAGHCYINAAGHIFDSSVPIRFQGETAEGIVIEPNVWIGAGCVVLDGVTIGSGSVIGAGSVVTRSVSTEAVCFGVPCQSRFVRSIIY